MSSRTYIALAALLTCVGLARVVATYATFLETYDEPWHVAIGMERLQWGVDTYDGQHLPLARVAVALGPYLAGVRSEVHRNVDTEGPNVLFEDGTAIFEAGGRHWRNLTLSRSGVLPFLVLACVVAFLWARRWFSPAAGVWAVLLLISTPPILGHAGVATVDMACAATVLTALYGFLRWLETPGSKRAGWLRAAWLGLAVALAFLTKLSSVPFLGACFAVALLLRSCRIDWRRAARQAAIAVGVAMFTLWAGYGFTLLPLEDAWGPHPRIDALLESHAAVARIWKAASSMPLPLTEFVTGVRDVGRHNALGHDSYLLGEYRSTGWWYFFPVVLAVKTPIGLLLLACGGLAWILRRSRDVPWQRLLTAVFPLVILAVCMTSSIDLGVRHILPIYPLLSVIAGYVVSEAVRLRGLRGLALVPIALALWVVLDSLRIHPDYLAYFNQFAPRPERILTESDLDWGQDLDRLSRRLRELNAPEVSIAYFGMALLQTSGLPVYHFIDPFKPSRGYVAISLHHLYLTHAKDGSYDWLKQHTPRERIGKSIDLFYIE